MVTQWLQQRIDSPIGFRSIGISTWKRRRFYYLVYFFTILGAAFAQPSIDTTLLADELETVIVRAQFLPTDIRNNVNTVRIINQRTIAQRAVTNLEELLQTEVGIRLGQDPVLGSSLSINGMQGENVKILIDGVPVVGRLAGSVDPGQLPLNNVQQVEIIEGAQSLLYGSDASAGVINLVTQKSQLTPWEASIQGQQESNGFRTLNTRLGAQVGAWNFAVHGNYLQFDPTENQDSTTTRDRVWNPKLQYNVGSIVRFRPSDQIDLRLTTNWFDEDIDNLGELRRPRFQPYAFDDYYQTTRQDITLHGEGRTKRNWFWQATMARNKFDRTKNTYRYEFTDETQSLVDGQQDTSSNLGWLTRFTLASDKRDKTFNYLTGIEWYRETARGQRIADTSAVEAGVAHNRNFAFFGSIKGVFFNQKLTTQAGARLTSNPGFGETLNPSIWLLYRPYPQWQIRASYANGLRVPGLKERYHNFIDASHFIVGTPDLLAEQSDNWRLEVTLPETKLLDGRGRMKLVANGFYNTVRNRIVLAEYAPREFNYANLSRWETVGGGLNVQFDLQQNIRFRSGLLYTGFYNSLEEEADSVSTFSWSPDWTNEIDLRLYHNKLSFTIWHKLTGARPFFFFEDGEIRSGEVDGWHQLNTSVQTKFVEGKVILTTGVKNILDIRQIRSGNIGEAHSGTDSLRPVHWGRTWFVTLRFQLSGGKER